MRYNCEFYYLLGTNRKHKSKSSVPDVRTKSHGYLISIRDMCFECETLVSLPRWALDLICAIYVRLLYACSSQMGPRWNSIFCLQETEAFSGFLYFKARVFFPFFFFITERQNLGNWLWITGKYETGRCCLSLPVSPGDSYPGLLLFKLSVLMAEAVYWFYVLNLTGREPPSRHHCPDLKCICLYVVWFLQIHLWGL